MPEISMDTAMRLAVFRAELAGGTVSTSRGPGLARVEVTLPGIQGTVASFSRDRVGKGISQLFRAGGEALSRPMDLSDPLAFASFMHNVDCEMHRSDEGRDRRRPDPVPGFVGEWADAAYASSDPAVSDAVRGLVSLDPMAPATPDTASTTWYLPPAAVPLLDACLASRDWRVKRVAQSVDLADRKNYFSTTFSPGSSEIGWLEQVREWLQPDEQEETLAAEGDFTWTWLAEPINRASASVAMGLPAGTLETMGGKDATFWELRDGSSSTVGVAAATPDGIVARTGMHPEDGAHARWEACGEAAISMLADHCGVPRAAPAPVPSP